MFEDQSPIGALEEMESEIYWSDTYGHSLKSFIFLRWLFNQEIKDGVHSIKLTGDNFFTFSFEKSNNIISHLDSIQELSKEFSNRLFSAKVTHMIIGSRANEKEATEIRIYQLVNDEIHALTLDEIHALKSFSIEESGSHPPVIVIPKEWSYDFKDIPRGLIT